MLRRHCRSDQHRRVLACLLECRTKGTHWLEPLQLSKSVRRWHESCFVFWIVAVDNIYPNP